MIYFAPIINFYSAVSGFYLDLFLDLLGRNFLSFLLDNIEYPPDTDIDEQIPDLFLNCIISFNLQFYDVDENPVLNVLQERDVAKTFTEKILLLLNREGKYLSIEGKKAVNNQLQRTLSGFLNTNLHHRTHYLSCL